MRAAHLAIALVAAAGCAGATAPGVLAVAITGDGTFDPARVSRLVLAVDGDGAGRVNQEVPLGAGGAGLGGSGASTVYRPKGGGALVLSAVALDASGARVASGLTDPIAGSATIAVTLTLSTAGRVDAGSGGRPPDFRMLPD